MSLPTLYDDELRVPGRDGELRTILRAVPVIYDLLRATYGGWLAHDPGNADSLVRLHGALIIMSLADLPEAARSKTYMGYSDAGFLLAGMHKAGLDVAWGPMPQDALRGDHGLGSGQAAVARALDWLVDRDAAALEPRLDRPAMAFNLTVLATLLGTVLEPDFSGVELLIEDVGEHHYRIDRTMFHVAASPNVRKVARLRLGRVGEIPSNDPDFGRDEAQIIEEWCRRSGIQYGGRADIGHDAGNKVVPFGAKNR